MSASQRDVIEAWVSGILEDRAARSGKRDRHPTHKFGDNTHFDIRSRASEEAIAEEGEDPEPDQRPRRRTSRSPSRPPSEASSYGSTDSGLSHPPQTWGKKKKKKIVQISDKELAYVPYIELSSEGSACEGPSHWPTIIDSTEAQTPRPFGPPPNTRSRQEAGAKSGVVVRSRRVRHTFSERRRTPPADPDRTPRPFGAPANPQGVREYGPDEATYARQVVLERRPMPPHDDNRYSRPSVETIVSAPETIDTSSRETRRSRRVELERQEPSKVAEDRQALWERLRRDNERLETERIRRLETRMMSGPRRRATRSPKFQYGDGNQGRDVPVLEPNSRRSRIPIRFKEVPYEISEDGSKLSRLADGTRVKLVE